MNCGCGCRESRPASSYPCRGTVLSLSLAPLNCPSVIYLLPCCGRRLRCGPAARTVRAWLMSRASASAAACLYPCVLYRRRHQHIYACPRFVLSLLSNNCHSLLLAASWQVSGTVINGARYGRSDQSAESQLACANRQQSPRNLNSQPSLAHASSLAASECCMHAPLVACCSASNSLEPHIITSCRPPITP